MPSTIPAPGHVSGRDPRLDVFRGLALAMIYINHVPGQIYENLTSRNFGHSDAAEAFVFMSGTAAAMAYGPKLAAGLNLSTVQKIWGRSWLLYMIHIMLSIWAIAIFSTAALHFGGEGLMKKIALSPLAEQPLEFLIGIATLTHQLGYVNILPMYAVLLLATPFLIRIGQRTPLGLLGGSVAVWALVGQFRLNLPNSVFEGGWFFNPLSWQLIFTLGLLTGLAFRSHNRFVPIKRWLVMTCAAWLIFSAVWVNSDMLQKGLGHVIWQLREWDVPFYLVTFDKTYVGLPRLSHFLALAYILSLPGLIPKLAAHPAFAPLRLMGRHGLPVFAAGTALAILAQAIRYVAPGGVVQDTVLIWGGLAVLYGFAWLREHLAAPKPKPMPTTRGTAPGAEPQMPLADKILPLPRKAPVR
ncbi:hypothetical protein BFP70_03840 [Thioclava sp. SK-1]|uniref:OpgC family protein n=1 Tax=Thioclava sp. SK-1 TaxID=1889770 RepID=UPI00082716E3|nr:OpgC domain-containing protein [Thioclava sp. SK-1]OCX66963.1 hypothetical protein BFP70_03840 [Thioclava sp. SK-1]